MTTAADPGGEVEKRTTTGRSPAVARPNRTPERQPDATAVRRKVRSAGAWCAPLTGFRALAAVSVAVAHSFLSTRTHPFAGAVQVIGIVVPVFFVISAYALYRPFIVDDLKGAAPRPAREFWWRRFLRVHPLYAVALTAYLVLLPALRPASGRIVEYLKLYGFLQVYDRELSGFSGIPAAWFLCDEVAFYLFLPAIAFTARRVAALGKRRARSAEDVLRGHAMVAIGMWCIGFVARPVLILHKVPAANALPISNLDFYGLGILLGVATLWEREGLELPKPVRWLRRRPWVAFGYVVIGALVISFAATDPAIWTRQQDVLRYLMWTIMVIPAAIVMILGNQRAEPNRFLSDPRWRWLAVLSLHVYLWHQLILGGFDRYVQPIAELRIGPRFTTGLIVALSTAIASVALSALLRPALDWPYRRWSTAADVAPRRGRGKNRSGPRNTSPARTARRGRPPSRTGDRSGRPLRRVRDRSNR